jgi:hypothetical protein
LGIKKPSRFKILLKILGDKATRQPLPFKGGGQNLLPYFLQVNLKN